MCTSAATTPPSESFTTSPGTSSAAGTVFHAPSRRTDAFSASRDFSAVRVAWARLSWNSPSAALNTSRPAMIAASTYLPSTSSSTIAASSIHGTGAQNFSSRHAQRMHARIRHRVGAELSQQAAGLVACQAVRQVILCGTRRLGIGFRVGLGRGLRFRSRGWIGIEFHNGCSFYLLDVAGFVTAFSASRDFSAVRVA